MSGQQAVGKPTNGHSSSRGGDNANSSLFASLTGGIMARKGEAAPAPAHLDGVSIHSHGVVREHEIERPSFEQPDPVTPPAPVAREAYVPEVEVEAETEVLPGRMAAKEARRRAVRRANLAGGDCCEISLPKAVTSILPEGPKSTVTTRIDMERVRKLKILAARMGTTNQKIMLAALDHYLEFVGEELAAECPCLARSMADRVSDEAD